MSEDGLRYAIRFRRYAQADAQEALVRLAELTDAAYAVAWYAGLQNAVATLATFPKRWPVADKNRFFRDEVRVMPYRYTPSGAAYQIFYTIAESEEDTPYVFVLHLRHAARKPMTRAEAWKIEEDEA